MDHAQLSSLTNFTWNIADDVLRGRYRDIILPMTVVPLMEKYRPRRTSAVCAVAAKLPYLPMEVGHEPNHATMDEAEDLEDSPTED